MSSLRRTSCVGAIVTSLLACPSLGAQSDPRVTPRATRIEPRAGPQDSSVVRKRIPIVKGALIGALIGFAAGYVIESGLCENTGCDGPVDDALVGAGIGASVGGLIDLLDWWWTKGGTARLRTASKAYCASNADLAPDGQNAKPPRSRGPVSVRAELLQHRLASPVEGQETGGCPVKLGWGYSEPLPVPILQPGAR